jgi:hypothetical protein
MVNVYSSNVFFTIPSSLEASLGEKHLRSFRSFRSYFTHPVSTPVPDLQMEAAPVSGAKESRRGGHWHQAGDYSSKRESTRDRDRYGLFGRRVAEVTRCRFFFLLYGVK